jgi:hypothetical protein
MATLRNVPISLLRLHDVTNIAAALRHNARKDAAYSNASDSHQHEHMPTDFAVPVGFRT